MNSAPECTAAGVNHRSPCGPDRLLANHGLDQHSNAAAGHLLAPVSSYRARRRQCGSRSDWARIPDSTHKTERQHPSIG